MTILEAEKIKMPFGHYKGETLGEIAAADVLYLQWFAGKQSSDGYLAEAVGVLVEKHGAKIAEKQARGERPKLFDRTQHLPQVRRPIQQKLF